MSISTADTDRKTTTAPTDWTSLASLEPRLVELAARAACADPHDEREWVNIRRDLAGLIGWGAADPRLSGSRAYEIAIMHARRLFEGVSTRGRRAPTPKSRSRGRYGSSKA